MASKKLHKGEYLFHEGDPSDSMYVIKQGRLAITKGMDKNEIVLAELAPGAMLGEMAFFDNKPRSAGAKALQTTEVIALPFKGLHAQFKTFPEWSKAIMRTVNEHLRNANKRIKELEKFNKKDDELFPPHTIKLLMSILGLVAQRYGVQEEGKTEHETGIALNYERIRKYTIQIFQAATHKMEKLLEALESIEILTQFDMGEGRKKVVIHKLDLIFGFVEWYNDWLFQPEDARMTITPEELKLIGALVHFAKKKEPNEKGEVKLSLTEVQNDSMREVEFLIRVEEVDPLIEKNLLSDKIMEEDGIYTTLLLENLEKVVPFWDLLYKLELYAKKDQKAHT